MSTKSNVNRAKAGRTVYRKSHNPFFRLIEFSVRGKSNPVLKTCCANDHVAQLSNLLAFDTDDYFAWGPAGSEGKKAHLVLRELEARIFEDHDLKAAETMYAIATRASFEVLSMYLRHRDLFDKIAPQRRMLPSIFSIHPGTPSAVRQMRLDARLGTDTRDAFLIGSKGYFASSAESVGEFIGFGEPS